LDEVLQTTTIFSNVSKGILAKREDLMEVFGTDDEVAICKRILAEGELQVSDKERKVELDTLFGDVASVLSEKCVNPETKRPYTISMIERALRDVHFSVDPKRPAKAQALDHALPLLKERFPIDRSHMRLQINLPQSSYGELKDMLRSRDAVVEEEDILGAMVKITCLIEPGAFRAVHSLVQEAGPGGRVDVVSVAAGVGESSAAATSFEKIEKFEKLKVTDRIDNESRSGRFSNVNDNDNNNNSSSSNNKMESMKEPSRHGVAAEREIHDNSVFSIVYPRGPVSGLPEEHASRRERFAELDQLQPGWTVELRAREAGGPVEAVFYAPDGQRVGAFAVARRMALSSAKGVQKNVPL
jgi:ribosome maturation protein SDO1